MVKKQITPFGKSVLVQVDKKTGRVIEAGTLHHHRIKSSTQAEYDKRIKRALELGLAMPCSEIELYGFMEHYISEYSLSSIKVFHAAIKNWHSKHREPDPCSSQFVKDTIAGFKNLKAESKYKVRKVKPLTSHHLIAINDKLIIENTETSYRDRFIIMLMYYFALRESEVSDLYYNDIEIHSGVMTIHLRDAKAGEDFVSVEANPEDTELCIVHAFHDYLDISDHTRKRNDPLIYTYYGTSDKKRDTHISTKTIQRIIKGRIKEIGAADWYEFSGHSARRGHVTDSVEAGIHMTDISHHARMSIQIVKEYADRRATASSKALIAKINKEHKDENK